MTAFPDTPEQAAIVETAESGQSLTIDALAGTAKTDTILRIARRLVDRHGMDNMLLLAFGNAAATSAEERVKAAGLADELKVRTAHSLAYQSVGHRYGKRVSADGHFLLASALAEGSHLARFRPADPFAFAMHTVDLLARYCASKEREIGVEHLPELDKEDAVDPEALLEAARTVWPAVKDYNGMLPVFHDVYLKVYALAEVPLRFQVLYFDEAQDANACMFAFTERQKNLQRIYAGDENQSIFSFRRAINALKLLSHPRMTLTRSFRFGPNIAEYVNRILERKGVKLRVIGAGADPGRVTTSGLLASADVLLARTNLGMFEAALVALDSGVKGVSLHGGFKKHSQILLAANDLRNGRSVNHSVLSRFRTWDALVIASKSEQGSMLAPYVKMVDVHGDRLPDMIARLEAAQRSPSKGGLRLSTFHGFKGEQAPTVRWVGDVQSFVRDGAIDVEESNLWYVGLTRASSVLDLGGAAPIVTELLGDPTPITLAAPGPLFSSVSASAPQAQPESLAAASSQPPEPMRVLPSPAEEVLALLDQPVPAPGLPQSDASPAQRPVPAAVASARQPSLVRAVPVASTPQRPRLAISATALSVPRRDRYRAGRAGARFTAAGWIAGVGTDLNACEPWLIRRSGQGERELPVMRAVRIQPTAEPRWLVGEGWSERVGRAAASTARSAIARAQQQRCAYCSVHGALNLHVHIEYAGPVAKMTRLIGLCEPCHSTQHIDRVKDEHGVIAHLMRVNREDEAMTRVRLDLAREELRRRNESWYLLEDAVIVPESTSRIDVWQTVCAMFRTPQRAFMRWFLRANA